MTTQEKTMVDERELQQAEIRRLRTGALEYVEKALKGNDRGEVNSQVFVAAIDLLKNFPRESLRAPTTGAPSGNPKLAELMEADHDCHGAYFKLLGVKRYPGKDVAQLYVEIPVTFEPDEAGRAAKQFWRWDVSLDPLVRSLTDAADVHR